MAFLNPLSAPLDDDITAFARVDLNSRNRGSWIHESIFQSCKFSGCNFNASRKNVQWYGYDMAYRYLESVRSEHGTNRFG